MNSRMNYRKGFGNLPENEVQIRAPWVPQTPGNPIISRSNGNGVPVGRHVVNQPGITNFPDLIGSSDQQFQQHMNYNGTRENFSTIGFLGQNGRSYDLGVQQAQQGNSHQRIGSYNLGVQQALQGDSNQMVRSYNLAVQQAQQGVSNQRVGSYNLGVQQAQQGVSNQRVGSYDLGVQQAQQGVSSQRVGSYNLGVQQAQLGSSNQMVGSYTENFGNDGAVSYNNPLAEVFTKKSVASVASVNGAFSKNMQSENILPTILNSYTQVDSSWTEGNFTNLLLGSENHDLDLNQNLTLDSNHLIMANEAMQMPGDGFPVPFRPNYNLNSPPRSEADATSSTTNSFPFAPVTPDHAKQFENHHRSMMLSFSVDESSSQEKEKLENLLSSSEAIEDHCTELLQNTVDSSSAAVSMSVMEKNNVVEGDQGIDLNKTPQLKPPKRRKHRPKVVVEGKPKRTPKPKTPINSNSNETPTGKRKYVRKKPVVTKEVKLPTSESKEKSCKMKLNFDLENDENAEMQGKADNLPEKINQVKPADFNLNLDSHERELCTRINSVGAETSEIRVQNGKTYTHNHPVNQMPAERIPLPERHCAPASPAGIKHHTLNALARSLSMRNGSPYQNGDKNGYSHEHQHLQREFSRNVSQKQQNTCLNPEETRQMAWRSTPQTVALSATNSNERRGLKREYRNGVVQAGFASYSQMGSPFLCRGTYQVHEHNANSHNFGTDSEIQKRRRLENEIHLKEGRNIFYANSYPFNGRILDVNFGGDKTPTKMMNGINSSGRQSHFLTSVHHLQKQIQPSELHPSTQSTAQKKLNGSTHVNDMTSLIMMANSHLLSSTLSRKGPITYGFEQGVETSQVNRSVNGLQMASTSFNLVSHDYRQSSTKIRGQPGQQQYMDAIHEITCRLQLLNITGLSKDNTRQGQNAIVPYKGDGAMVPYEGLDNIKKRKPRPKVDLDPETNRIWQLLMGKEASEGDEAEDKSKEKWWEDERRVFCGRADSFIARMHLVQGDRRFSRWKGSVVDSIIGVFLTQNVSDHLSSSAFMALAARFPLWSKTADPGCYESGTVSTKEPEIQMLFPPNGTIKWHDKIVRQPVYNQASVLYQETSESRIGEPTSGTGRTSPETEHNRLGDASLSSSQSSSEFYSLEVNKGVNSYTGSNSEAEDSSHKSRANLNNGPLTLPHTRTSPFQELQSPVHGNLHFDERSTHLQNQSAHMNHHWQIPGLDIVNTRKSPATSTHLVNSNISQHKQGPYPPACFPTQMTQSLAVQGAGHYRIFNEVPSTPSGVANGRQRDYASRTGHTPERTFVEQNGVPLIQAPTPSLFSQTGKGHFSLTTHQQERSTTFHSESTLAKEPGRREMVARGQIGSRHQLPKDPQNRSQAFDAEQGINVSHKQKLQGTKIVEANAKDELYSSGKTTTGMGINTSNTRKGKREDEKRNAFDWDSLRKLVEPNGRKNERSKEAMDSLDYEALRRADVSEVSKAIKERGMNNMLAERIQDFLNRVVRDHGSIDLEWLRDVPPDKAKDYLLSIWGLGLKSVECVRLLTLHHLAFPVDTNVGRIAVRLGWVPLQPLPESLQLHLLELYPMLETIQKYLWPRLCKLDQRTLYELHYQMITFGKVFCTKSKPNCNACPMRGECRHFASAFASARLALPGPEEKSIVSSATSAATEKNPTIGIRPMPLLMAGRNEPKEIGSVLRNCEPIVEEPATPEPETAELTVSDIEDAFYEDPDEIPTIKLNIEEFTLNLHNYVQENMELQEGDMSKALVALNPQAASIPTPKLKNVSRLRTEHQVYELPDSHPLLNQMDKREPDDPSPYLLAIWTPGETADSIQLPEGRCASQESGKLCNEKTCFSCNSMREANAHTVRGTILIPCRTAMRGSFPLNGTYFQVNEMFADHESSLKPIDVPRAWIWNLPRRTVYFGTSVTTIFKGLTTEGIQYCFWRGFVCVRGFDHRTRAPRPLMARLHFPASKLAKTKNEDK